MEEYEICLRKTDKKKIYLDPSDTEGLYLYPSEVSKLKLKDGSRITADRLEEIRRLYALPRAKKRAMAILARRDITEQQLREKLQESYHDSRSLEEAISFMKECGYVDDARYVEDYIYSKRRKKSFRMMRQELLRKGISAEVIDLVFEEDGGQREEDLLPLMTKYLRKFSTYDDLSRRKTMEHFLRKGYHTELVRSVYNHCREEEF